MFLSLREVCTKQKSVDFYGEYIMPSDPLVSDKERVKMTALEVWKVTGFRFTYVLVN